MANIEHLRPHLEQIVRAVLHPGRSFAEKLAPSSMSPAFLEKRVADYLAGRPLDKLPKAVAEELATEQSEAENSADQI